MCSDLDAEKQGSRIRIHGASHAFAVAPIVPCLREGAAKPWHPQESMPRWRRLDFKPPHHSRLSPGTKELLERGHPLRSRNDHGARITIQLKIIDHEVHLVLEIIRVYSQGMEAGVAVLADIEHAGFIIVDEERHR